VTVLWLVTRDLARHSTNYYSSHHRHGALVFLSITDQPASLAYIVTTDCYSNAQNTVQYRLRVRDYLGPTKLPQTRKLNSMRNASWLNGLKNTVLPPYPWVIRSKTYRGYVKPRIIPNAIYNVIFV
jgi:hypothetical protein